MKQEIMHKQIIDKVVEQFKTCQCIEAIVLGGSLATQTATVSSDIDIGIYYDQYDFDELNSIATRLDDEHREHLICYEGEWGQWVNAGGWLIIDGIHVDLILRDINKVKAMITQTNQGIVTSHYQTGHPHAYLNVMYRGELASCLVLNSKNKDFLSIKKQAEIYPLKLQKAMIDFFMFETEFSYMFLEKNISSSDNYYCMGHLFRAISALNQVLFAINKKYCLNEKKAVMRIEGFSYKPHHYQQRVQQLFQTLNNQTLIELKNLIQETKKLIS